jgi:CBS domain-containing protein
MAGVTPAMGAAMKVRDIMTSDVAVAGTGTPVHEIARLMDERDVSGVPVVDGGRHVVGLVTDLDLIVRNTRLDPPLFFQLLDARIPLETPGHYRKRLRHMLGTEARDVMSEDVVTIGPDEDGEALAALLVKSGANPIPVVEQGRLVGIVSRADLLRLMGREVGAAPAADGDIG